MIQSILWLIFLSALGITFLTDYYYLLIYRPVTLFLIPLFLCGALMGVTPCTLTQALAGIGFGYGFLWLFNVLYHFYRNKEGIGQGDLELLAMIGSFLGPLGVLYTITFGSLIGTFIAVIMLFLHKAHAQSALPFGSFLVIGCFLYVLILCDYCPWLQHLILY